MGLGFTPGCSPPAAPVRHRYVLSSTRKRLDGLTWCRFTPGLPCAISRESSPARAARTPGCLVTASLPRGLRSISPGEARALPWGPLQGVTRGKVGVSFRALRTERLTVLTGPLPHTQADGAGRPAYFPRQGVSHREAAGFLGGCSHSLRVRPLGGGFAHQRIRAGEEATQHQPEDSALDACTGC